MTGRSIYHLPAAALLALLTGCGPSVDDPANLPRLGNWTIETKLGAVSVNNMNIGRDQLAGQAEGRALIDKVESTEEQSCVEPTINNDDDLLEAATSALDDCAIVNSAINGTSRHVELSCTLNGNPAHAVLDMTIDAESGYSRFRATTSEPKPTGGRNSTSIMISQTLTRTGDCG